MNAMTGNTPDLEEEEQPLDPAVERIRRKMIRLLIVSIGIMVVGLMTVFGAIIYKVNNREAPQEQTAATGMSVIPVPESANYIGKIDIPDGAKITSSSMSGTQILLHLTLSDGSQKLWLYDVPTGRQFGSIDIE